MAHRNNRVGRFKQYHGTYKPIVVNSRECWYCGEPADTKDHCPPLAAIGDGVRTDARWLIPCCSECNSLLGARSHTNPVMRRDAARNLIRTRYRRILQTPEWTDAEIKELDGRLKRTVLVAVRERSYLEARLSDTTLERGMIANDLVIDDQHFMVEKKYD